MRGVIVKSRQPSMKDHFHPSQPYTQPGDRTCTAATGTEVTWMGKLEQQRCLHVCMHYKSYTAKIIHVLTTNELHRPARISECHVMCAAVAASLKLSPACNKFAMCTASSKPCVRTRNSQRANILSYCFCYYIYIHIHM